MNNQPIGIFDSGLGGLSVLKEIEKLLPKENFIYVADQANFSYGLKSKKELEALTTKIVQFLINKKVKLVVVACNTATIQAIECLRKNFTIPIIGIVPVIKTISSISKTKNTAVFATPSTTKSKYLSSLIKKYAHGVKVYKISGIGLEQLIEQGEFNDGRIKNALEKSLAKLKNKNIDVIALGCTHYPFIKPQIQRILGSKITIIDSGGAVARRVKSILIQENLLAGDKRENSFYTSCDAKRFKRMLKSLLRIETDNVFGLNI